MRPQPPRNEAVGKLPDSGCGAGIENWQNAPFFDAWIVNCQPHLRQSKSVSCFPAEWGSVRVEFVTWIAPV
jgi:hypothetical protein